MLNLRAAHRLHTSTCPYHHLLAVARLVVLLASNISHVGIVVGHHFVVIGVVARGNYDALGAIELNVAIIGVANHTNNLAGVIFNKLLGTRGVENLQAVFATEIIAQILHARARVIRLRAVVECEISDGLTVNRADGRSPLRRRIDDLASRFSGLVPQPLQSLARIIRP